MPLDLLCCPLRPRYAKTWPEAPQDAANVLCEGPSVLGASRSDLLPGPVLAVNRAIALSETFPIDFWASSDDPRNLWEWAKPYFPSGCKILSVDNNIPVWHRLLGHRTTNRKLYAPDPTFMDRVDETNEGYIGSDGKAPLVPTVMHAIGWLYRLGVKRVRLFGCDMRGEGSPLGSIPWQEAESDGTKFRWGVERTMLGLSMKGYRKTDQRLERWKER